MALGTEIKFGADSGYVCWAKMVLDNVTVHDNVLRVPTDARQQRVFQSSPLCPHRGGQVGSTAHTGWAALSPYVLRLAVVSEG